jgi:hypothetical protein
VITERAMEAEITVLATIRATARGACLALINCFDIMFKPFVFASQVDRRHDFADSEAGPRVERRQLWSGKTTAYPSPLSIVGVNERGAAPPHVLWL